MKKILFVSSAVLSSIVLAQSAFASDSGALTKADLIAASQGYILASDERPEARRSALYAHILDYQTQDGTTLAQSEAPLVIPES